MAAMKDDCLEYAKDLLSLYFVQGNADALFAYAQKDAQLIGLEGRLSPGMSLAPRRMEEADLCAEELAPGLFEVVGSLAVTVGGSGPAERVEATLLLRRTERAYRLIRMHLSCADTSAAELRENISRYERVVELSGAVLFDWDMRKDIFRSPWAKRMGYPLPDKIGLMEAFKPYIHPDDLVLLKSAVASVQAGKPRFDLELRIADTSGKYRWWRMCAANVMDQEGIPQGLVGFFSDINGQKKDALLLRDRAEKDALTGIYNKMTAQAMAEAYLHNRCNDRLDALLVLDIDNFKQVNDTYGHLFGDEMLAGISANIKQLFRSSDIIGRIGGDEFIILIKDIPTETFAVQKARMVLELFAQFMKEKRVSRLLSCSIGIALSPQHGITYDSLFRAADTALYCAKAAGKNQVMLYHGEMEKQA